MNDTLWAIKEDALADMVNTGQAMGYSPFKQATALNDPLYPVNASGIADFAIRGVMTKFAGYFSSAVSTAALARDIRAAAEDTEVKGATLTLTTPGGTLWGLDDIASAVAEFAAKKPIYAFVDGMAASAGVAVASQATKRFANSPSATYGSMGVYSAISDTSKMAEGLGVKVHIVRAGQFKGAGHPGTEVTPDVLNHAQKLVDAGYSEYVGMIAKGLGMSIERVTAMADGSAFPAQDAVAKGLIDGIQSFDETVRQLVADVAGRRTLAKRGNPMSETVKTAATLAELKATFPKSTADWRETQIEKQASLQDASIAYAVLKEAEAEQASADLKAAQDKAAEQPPPVTRGIGHKPLIPAAGEATVVGGDVLAQFEDAVVKAMNGRKDYDARRTALRTIAKRNPALYAAFVAATNQSENPKLQRQVQDKVYDLMHSN